MESCNAVGRTVCIFPYAGMTRIRLTGEGCDLPSLSRNGSGPPKIICSAVEGILQDFPEKINRLLTIFSAPRENSPAGGRKR